MSPSPRSVVSASVVLLSTFGAVGCGTRVDYIPTNTPPSATAPRQAQEVDVFATVPPGIPYVEIGMLRAQQASTFSVDDRAAVIEEMREEAGELGCDALVILGNADKHGYVEGDAYSRSYTLEGFDAACVVYVNNPG